jgi:hypothetical protein
MTVITRRWNEVPQSLGVLCAQFADRVLPSVGDVSTAKPFVGLESNSVEILVNDQLDALFSVYLFHASTRFEEQVLIIRRIKLCQYIIWYNTL